jgi:DNA-binding response OmpR family regulator
MMIAMHGDITASKRLSLFTLQIPATSAVEIPLKTESSEALQDSPASNVKKISVLFVEDNKSNLALIEALIKRHPAVKLITCTSLKQAKSLLQDVSPTIILLDLNLPDGHGSELLSFLHQDKQHQKIKVWVLTADATEETKVKMLASGADTFFTKPLDVSLFNFKLKQIMSHQSSK